MSSTRRAPSNTLHQTAAAIVEAAGERHHEPDSLGSPMLAFSVRLGNTYWSKGFFNVSVDFQRHLTMTEGPFDIYLGDASKPINGRISRSANANATPRIFGNKPLTDFFQQNFKKGDDVLVEVLAPGAIRIVGHVGHVRKSRRVDQASFQPTPPRIVTAATSPPNSLTSSAPRVDIHDLYGHLARFCEWLWRDRQTAPMPSDLASLISGLQRQHVVPLVEAGMMHSIRTIRNSHVHEHRRLGPSEVQAVTAAWDIITRWAKREHAGRWKNTTDLPQP